MGHQKRLGLKPCAQLATRFFFMIRFYLMPWLLGYTVMGILSFPLESEFASATKLVDRETGELIETVGAPERAPGKATGLSLSGN